MDNKTYIMDIKESANYIKKQLGGFVPDILVILGSGLGELADKIDDPIIIPYKDIPNFVSSTVSGHKGQFVAGVLGGRNVICMQGRFHYYEGYSLRKVTFPVRVAKLLGVNSLIVTNAAGGVNESFEEGTLMIINDHINYAGANPLSGENLDSFGPRFPDMSRAYDREYMAIAKKVAGDINFNIREGVYVWFSGPNYESPAEVRFARTMGGDAVGMSTVPEVLVARHMGMRVLGISCITNMAAGVHDVILDHSEVTETANRVKGVFMELITGILQQLPLRYEIKTVIGLENLPICKEIRQAVFVDEQGFSNEFDEHDADALHIAITENGTAVATARAVKDGAFYKIGRVAVMPEFRSYGMGAYLMESIERAIKAHGGDKIKLSAQTRVRGFYEKQGYVAKGEEYLDEHCPHIDMVKTV